VVAIPIAGPTISWTVSVCHSTVRPPSPEVIAALELLRKEARHLARSGRWPARLPGATASQADRRRTAASARPLARR
jgi:hypothetical protein